MACTKSKEEMKLEKDELIKKNIKVWIDKHAHDPSSYEFIMLLPVDTIYQEDVIIRLTLSYDEKMKAFRDSIIKTIKPKTEIAHIVSNLKCRLKNKMGGLQIFEYYVQTDTIGNVFDIVDATNRINRMAGLKNQYNYLKQK
jgi:hypothetical protein